jgi:hypothetical protein
MRDDALLDQLRAQLKTYVEARERAELIAKAHSNKDIGREMAEFRKALDGAIAGALTILFAIPRARGGAERRAGRFLFDSIDGSERWGRRRRGSFGRGARAKR